MRQYLLNGEYVYVPPERVTAFKEKYPTATQAYDVNINGEVVTVNQNDLPRFISKYPNANIAGISTIAQTNYDRREKALRTQKKGRIYNEVAANENVRKAREADPIFSDYLTFRNLKEEAKKAKERPAYQNAIINSLQTINAFVANPLGTKQMNDAERELAQKTEITGQALTKPDDDISTWDNLLKPAEGDTRDFGNRFKAIADRTLRLGLQSSGISSLSIGLTALTGSSQVGSLPMFLMSMGQKKYALDTTRPDLTEATKITDAALTGLWEFGTEAYLGVAAQQVKWAKMPKVLPKITDKAFPKTWKALIQRSREMMTSNIGKRIGGAFGGEMAEGMVSQFLGNTTDYWLGVSNNPNVFDGVIDAGLIEGLSAVGSAQTAVGTIGSLNAMSRINRTAKNFESTYNKVIETEPDQSVTKDLFTMVNDFVDGMRNNDHKKATESRTIASALLNEKDIKPELKTTAQGMFDAIDAIYQGSMSTDDKEQAKAWMDNTFMTARTQPGHPYVRSSETVGANQKENIDINRLYSQLNEAYQASDITKARETKAKIEELGGNNEETDNVVSMLEERIKLAAQNQKTDHKAMREIKLNNTDKTKTIGDYEHSQPVESSFDHTESLRDMPLMDEAILTGNTEAILSRSVLTLLHNSITSYNGYLAEIMESKEPITPEQYRKLDLLYNRFQHHERNAMLFLTDQELIDLPETLKLGKMKNLESELKEADMPEQAYEAIIQSNYEKAAQSIDKSAELRIKNKVFPVSTEATGEDTKTRTYHYDKGTLTIEYDGENKIISGYKTEDGKSTTIDKDVMPEYINQLKVTDIIPEASPNVDVVKQQAEQQKKVAREKVDALEAAKQAKLDTEEKRQAAEEVKQQQKLLKQMEDETKASLIIQKKAERVSDMATAGIEKAKQKRLKDNAKILKKKLTQQKKEQDNPLKKVALQKPIYAMREDTGANIVVTDENKDFYWTSEGKKVKKSIVKTYESQEARTKAQTPIVKTPFEMEAREQMFKYYNPEAYDAIFEISKNKELDNAITSIARELVNGFAGKGAVDVKLAEQHLNELLKSKPELKTSREVKALKTAINSMKNHIQAIKDAFFSLREISGSKGQYTETKDYAFGRVIGKQVAKNKLKAQSQIPSRTEYIMVTKQTDEYVTTSTGQNYLKYRFTPMSAMQFVSESHYKQKSREAGRKRYKSRINNIDPELRNAVSISVDDLRNMRYAFALEGSVTNATGADAFNRYYVNGKPLVSVLDEFNVDNTGNALQQIIEQQKRAKQQQTGTLDPEHLLMKVSDAGNLLGDEDADTVYERTIQDLEYYVEHGKVRNWNMNDQELKEQAYLEAIAPMVDIWNEFETKMQSEYPNMFEDEPFIIPDADNMDEETYNQAFNSLSDALQQEISAVSLELQSLLDENPDMAEIMKHEIDQLNTKMLYINDTIMELKNISFQKAAEYGYSGMTTKQSAELLQSMFTGFETNIEYPSVDVAIINVGKNIRIKIDMLNDLFTTERGDKAAGSVKNLNTGKISTLMRIAQNYNKNNLTLYHEAWHLFKAVFQENEHFRSLDKYMSNVFNDMVGQVNSKGWDKTTGLGKELIQKHFKDKINNPKYRAEIIEEMQADYFAQVMFKNDSRADIKGIKKLMQDFMKWLVDTVHKFTHGRLFSETFDRQEMDRLFMESAIKQGKWELKDTKGNIIPNSNKTANADIRYKRITEADTELYNEVSKRITNIQDRTEIYERISQDTGVALPQVQEKFGRMMDRAERVTSGALEGLYKANNLLNALDTVKNNKIRNRNNMTLSVRSAKHLMHTMQFSDEQWDAIGQDAYSIPIASMQILAVANQYGADFLAIKDHLKNPDLLPVERTEYREAAKILISEYTKAMNKYNAILTAAGRTLRYAKEKNYARIEQIANTTRYMIAEVDGSQATLIIEQNTENIKALKAELNKLNALINRMTENGEYTPELDAMNDRALKIIEAIKDLQQFNAIAESQEDTVANKELLSEAQLDQLLKKTNDIDDPSQIEKLEEAIAPDIMDALQSMYYAAILSGPSTHVKNIIDTSINSMLNNVVGMITNPAAAFGMAVQPFMNIGKAFGRAGEMMTQDTWQSQKFNVGETNTKSQNIYAHIIHTTGYIGRLLAAEDAFTNTLIQSSFMYSLAVTESKRTGVPVEQLMKTPTVNMAKQAEYEARRSTYNNTPEGFVGIAINNLANWIAENRYHSKIAGYALVNIIPFTRIVGNVLNAGIDWTPIGALRAIQYARGTGTHQQELFGKKGTPYAMRDFSQQITKVILGTLGMALLYSIGAAITGAGPDDPERRQQLMASGWQPYSIKIGDRYVSYQYATGGLALPLSVVGNLRDEQEYGKSDKDPFRTLLWSVMGISKTIMDKSFFSGVTDVIEAVQNKNESWLMKYMANTVTNPFIPNLFKQINNQFDKNMSKPEAIWDYALINLKPYTNLAGWQPVPEQIDIFGNPRKRTGGALATLGYSIGTPQQIIAMNGVDISNIIQQLNDQKVFMKIGSEAPDIYVAKDVKKPMTPEQFRDFQIYRGRALSMYLLMKQNKINYFYSIGNTEQQQKLIDKITRKARERALKEMGDYRYE